VSTTCSGEGVRCFRDRVLPFILISYGGDKATRALSNFSSSFHHEHTSSYERPLPKPLRLTSFLHAPDERALEEETEKETEIEKREVERETDQREERSSWS
jgi:hypothetical protein